MRKHFSLALRTALIDSVNLHRRQKTVAMTRSQFKLIMSVMSARTVPIMTWKRTNSRSSRIRTMTWPQPTRTCQIYRVCQ